MDPVDRTARFPVGAVVTLEDLAGDVHPCLARLRTAEPVSWLPAIGGWLVTGRDSALAVLRDADSFTVDDPRFSTARVVGPSMLSTDGADHARHRAPFAGAFRHSVVMDGFGDWTAIEARRLLAEHLAIGRCDLRAVLAAPLAVGVIARALNLEEADPDRVLGWYRAIVAGVEGVNAGREVGDGTRRAVADLRRTVDRTVRDSAGSLLAEVAEGGSLTADELFSNTAVLMFGAIETSEGMTANALAHLLGDAAQLEAVAADRSLVANAVEESLRMEPAATLVDRYATRAVELAGASISVGDLVSVSLAGANRDPTVFADPDRFDSGRPNLNLQLAFVRGPHTCLGLHLARLQTIAAVEAVLDLVPDARLRDDFQPARGLVFRKPATVPVTWNPAMEATVSTVRSPA
jgi:cytochrome P450